MKPLFLSLALAAAALAQNYTAQQITEQGVAIVRLSDAAHGVEVNIMPSAGNRAYELKVHGKNILYSNVTDLAAYEKRAPLSGIPFLAPWANRLTDTSFWANGKKYNFNMDLGNVAARGLSIHGLLTTSPLWKVTEVAADQQSAHVTSKLEFWKYPTLMAQWPFAHEYEMTYRLSNGALEVRTTITNLSVEPMPVMIGFHAYYRIPDVPRDEWSAHLPARKAVVADDRLIPTGEFKPMDLPDPLPLKGHTLDNGYTDLVRDADGRALFSIAAGDKKVEVLFGRNFPAAVVYLPPVPQAQPGQPSRDYICFEPMGNITNAPNLNHDGKYPDLQSVAPGAKWTESFWVRASGI
jgi:aldose 1-epimerase